MEKNIGRSLYGYFLHYNYHKGLWAAIPDSERDKYKNGEAINVLYNTDLDELIIDVMHYENERIKGEKECSQRHFEPSHIRC